MPSERPNLDLLLMAGLIILLLVIGTAAFSYLEGWSIIDALYFSVSTISTIGYGDLVPTSEMSKLVMIIYGLVGISMLLFLVSKLMAREERLIERVSQHFAHRDAEAIERQVEHEVRKNVQKHVEKEVQKHMEKQRQAGQGE